MTHRKRTPLHDKWHRIVEGQLRDAMYSHPEWFALNNKGQRRAAINSIAKRIVGDIVAELDSVGASKVPVEPEGVAVYCTDPAASGG